jgi:hypothetical protein
MPKINSKGVFVNMGSGLHVSFEISFPLEVGTLFIMCGFSGASIF